MAETLFRSPKFHSPSDELDLTDLNSFEKELSFEYLSEEDGPPNMFEIESALKRLKNNKSPGVDNISNEQLKYGIEGLKDQLGPWCYIWEGMGGRSYSSGLE